MTQPQTTTETPQLSLRAKLRDYVPITARLLLRLVRTADGPSIVSFLLSNDLPLSFLERAQMLRRFYRISRNIKCAHLESELLAFVVETLPMPRAVTGCLIEAGCFKGGSTAKLSIAANLAGRKLVVFDSFEGIPDNDEDHGRTMFGGPAVFRKGDYCGALEEVAENVRRYGELAACSFIKGDFKDTMPQFHEPVAGAYLDVDLASSTRTCLKYLWPLLVPGGALFSQDGHLPLVLAVLKDRGFWNEELGCDPPEIVGMGRNKLIRMRKPATADSLSKAAAIT